MKPSLEEIISVEDIISLPIEDKTRRKIARGAVTTSIIVQNLKSSVNGYDTRARNLWWRDAIREYDIFMGDTRPYWLKRPHYNYQKLLRSEGFIEEVRRVLEAFGMDRRGSVLTGIGLFLDATAEAGQDFNLLARAGILLETLNLKKKIEGETVASVIGRIYNLFSQAKRLSLSGGVVIASKTMHMIMPELFIMIDRRIMRRLHEVSDYYPHPSDGKNWYDVIPNYSGYQSLNPFPGYAWDCDQRYFAALMYYTRIILEWRQQNNTDIAGFLELGVRTVTTDVVFGTKVEVKATTARIIDMALW